MDLPQIKEQHTHKGEGPLDLHGAVHDSDQLNKKQTQELTQKT